MKCMYLAILATFALAGAVAADASEALVKSSGCLGCHSIDARKIGPSFKDTAAKYKGKPGADATVAATLADPKKHPATRVKPDDLPALVAWVLAQ